MKRWSKKSMLQHLNKVIISLHSRTMRRRTVMRDNGPCAWHANLELWWRHYNSLGPRHAVSLARSPCFVAGDVKELRLLSQSQRCLTSDTIHVFQKKIRKMLRGPARSGRQSFFASPPPSKVRCPPHNARTSHVVFPLLTTIRTPRTDNLSTVWAQSFEVVGILALFASSSKLG